LQLLLAVKHEKISSQSSTGVIIRTCLCVGMIELPAGSADVAATQSKCGASSLLTKDEAFQSAKDDTADQENTYKCSGPQQQLLPSTVAHAISSASAEANSGQRWILAALLQPALMLPPLQPPCYWLLISG
jgi:hypothetical protein